MAKASTRKNTIEARLAEPGIYDEANKAAEKEAAKAAKEKAKSDYQNAKKIYKEAKKAIDDKFKNAVKAARSAFKTAKNSTLTPEQLNQLVSTRDSAIAAATATRDSEMAALGAAPVKPVN